MTVLSRPITHAIMFAGAALSLCGCESAFRAPASASLSELTFETKSQSGILFDHNQVTSITGLFPVPDVGMFIHYSNPRDPTTAIGISKNHSFKLVGTVGGVGNAPLAGFDDVVAIREQVQLAQNKAVAAIANASEQRTIEARLQKLSASISSDVKLKSAIEVAGKSTDQSILNTLPDLKAKLDKLTADNAAANADITKLKERLAELKKAAPSLEEAFNSAESKVQTISKKNGLIIARWNASTSSGFGIKAARFANAGASSSNTLGGFMILAEPRVQMLYIGDDFLQFLQFLVGKPSPGAPPALTDADVTLFSKESFPTYQLQAKHIAYVAERDLADSFDLSVHFAVSDVVGVGINDFLFDEIAFNYYSNRLAKLGNQGTISGVKWVRESYCFFAGSDLIPDITSPNETSINGWSTVLTQNASMGSLTPTFLQYASNSNYPKKKGRLPCTEQSCAEFPKLKYRADSPPPTATH